MDTLLITILPSVMILGYFIYNDKFKEPTNLILTVFFLGFLICLPAGILNEFSENQFFTGTDLSKRLVYSFLGPAWAEEILKFLILYLIVLRRNEFNEPMDGIVYGVVVSLGFATYENYDYVFRLAEAWDVDPMQMAIWRSYSAVPMHGLNGVVMGYFFGLYAFTGNKNYLILSILLPYLIHGTYNYLTYPDHFFVILFTLIISKFLHNKIKKVQSKKKKEKKIKKV